MYGHIFSNGNLRIGRSCCTLSIFKTFITLTTMSCVVCVLLAGRCAVDGGEEEDVAGVGREIEVGDRISRQ